MNNDRFSHMDTVEVTMKSSSKQIGFICGYSRDVNTGSISIIDLCCGFVWSYFQDRIWKNFFYRRVTSIQKIRITRMVLFEKTINIKERIKSIEQRRHLSIYDDRSLKREREIGERAIYKAYWEK